MKYMGVRKERMLLDLVAAAVHGDGPGLKYLVDDYQTLEDTRDALGACAILCAAIIRGTNDPDEVLRDWSDQLAERAAGMQ